MHDGHKLFDFDDNEEEELLIASNDNTKFYSQLNNSKNRKRSRRKSTLDDNILTISEFSDDGSEESDIHNEYDEDVNNYDENAQVATTSVSNARIRVQHKRSRRITKPVRYDKYIQLPYGSLNTVSQSIMDRAVEYMQLYLMRYERGQIKKDLVRRMFFNARLFGAPLQRLEITPYVKQNIIAASLQVPIVYNRPINLRHFFNAMDKLEQRVGYRHWDFFYISGEHFLNRNELGQMDFFRYQLISVVRKLHNAAMRRDWSAAAECIAEIPLWLFHQQQQHSRVHFEFLSRTLGPYLPSIFLMALQCLLESRLQISEMGKQFLMIVNAFKKTSSQRQLWRDQRLFYHSHLLLFYLLNLHFETPSDPIISINLQGIPERRRIILLLNYCIDVERHFIRLFNREDQKQIQDRSLAQHFPNFMATLFEEPRDSVSLLPLAVWGARQFDCIEELTDYLLEACTIYPYLLLPVYNVLSRFDLIDVAGQLLAQLFDLALELLSTSNFLLDLIEQRSLDPSNFGQFDDVINGNLRGIFMFLDYGRNRADQRAWALLYSNLCYIKDNEELMNAFVHPLWERRKSWWPKFHNKERVPLSTFDAEKMRKRVLRLLKKQFR